MCGDDQGSLWLYNVKSLLCHGSTAGILSCSRVCFFQFLFCTVNCIVRELHYLTSSHFLKYVHFTKTFELFTLKYNFFLIKLDLRVFSRKLQLCLFHNVTCIRTHDDALQLSY